MATARVFPPFLKNFFRPRRNTVLVLARCCSQGAQEILPRNAKAIRKLKSEVARQNRQNPALEKAARYAKLSIDLEGVHKEWTVNQNGSHIRSLAKHSGIFDHVFDGEEFSPCVNLDIRYESGAKVHHGNFLTPSQALLEPDVQYTSDEDTMWSLLLTTPDGNIWEKDTELLHWLVVNIQGSRVSNGTVLCEYLPPIPPQGTGFHRYTFCLLRQEQQLKPYTLPTFRSLTDRSISTSALISKVQDRLTPVGLGFFQASWDDSVTQTFRDIIGMPEPIYQRKPFITPAIARRGMARERFSAKYTNM